MAVDKQPTNPDRIVRNPEILGGKPTVRGTRIPVGLVVGYLARNPNFDNLFADYPRLTLEDVKACLAYAEDAVQQCDETSPDALPSARA